MVILDSEDNGSEVSTEAASAKGNLALKGLCLLPRSNGFVCAVFGGNPCFKVVGEALAQTPEMVSMVVVLSEGEQEASIALAAAAGSTHQRGLSRWRPLATRFSENCSQIAMSSNRLSCWWFVRTKVTRCNSLQRAKTKDAIYECRFLPRRGETRERNCARPRLPHRTAAARKKRRESPLISKIKELSVPRVLGRREPGRETGGWVAAAWSGQVQMPFRIYWL